MSLHVALGERGFRAVLRGFAPTREVGMAPETAKEILGDSMLTIEESATYTRQGNPESYLQANPQLATVPYHGHQLISRAWDMVLFPDGFSLRRLYRQFRGGLLTVPPQIWEDENIVNLPDLPQWCLMMRRSLRGSEGFPLARAEKQLPDSEFIPSARQVASAALLEFGLRRSILLSQPVLTSTVCGRDRVEVIQERSGEVHLRLVPMLFRHEDVGIAIALRRIR